MSALLKPHSVPGDAAVAVVSPASTPQPERVERGLEALRALGYAPQSRPNMSGARAALLCRNAADAARAICITPLPTTRCAPSSARAAATARIICSRAGSRPDCRKRQAVHRLQRSDRAATVAARPDSACRPFTAPCCRRILRAKTACIWPACKRRSPASRTRVGAAEGLRTLHAGPRARHALRRLPQHSGGAAGHAL